MAGLANKVAIVTGASSGIGLAAAHALLEAGSLVLGVDVSPQPDWPISLGPSFAFLQIDITLPEAPKVVVDTAQKAFGPKIHVLLNVAGVLDKNSSVEGILDEDWERTIAVNLTAPVRLMREVVRVMKKCNAGEGGSIVNVSSKAGLSGAVAGVAYTASKHGLIGVTKNTAFLHKDDGIRCNAIAPGAVRTNMSARVMRDEWDTETAEKMAPVLNLHQKVELIREGKGLLAPEQVAETLVFLASEASQGINGAVLPIDNAWSTL